MVLHVGRGTSEPEELDITPKPGDAAFEAYEQEMWERVAAFRLCLRTFTPPVPMPRVITPEIWRTVDLTQEPLPNWGFVMLELLKLYENTREAHDEHEATGKDVRKLMPDDVSIVLAGEHKLTRDKRGIISIRRKAA